MKKTLTALAAIAFCGACAAQSSGYYLQNDGRINNTVSTYATANGNGTSYSAAGATNSAAANGYVTLKNVCDGGKIAIGGTSTTDSTSFAYNVSTGNGTGSASSVGWTDSRVFGNVTYAAPDGHQFVTLTGSTDSGMTNAVRNGVDFSVIAGRSQDGYANGSSMGTFTGLGFSMQTPISGGAKVNAGVSDTKNSTSSVDVGGITFAGGTPAGQSAAARYANAGSVVNVSGSFVDPVVVTNIVLK